MPRLIVYPFRRCSSPSAGGFGCWYVTSDGCTVCRFCHREIPVEDLRRALGKDAGEPLLPFPETT